MPLSETFGYTEPFSVVKIALDPSPRQLRRLDAYDHAARFAFNWTLDVLKREIAIVWEQVHGFRRFWNFYQLRALWNQWKHVAFPDWSAISKEVFSSGIQDAIRAFDNWYDSIVGKRKGQKAGFPRYRSFRGSVHSFNFTTGSFGLVKPDRRSKRHRDDSHAVQIPKIGRVHAFENVRKRVGDGVVSSMRVVFEANRWFAVLLLHDKTFAKKRHKKERSPVGLDVGCKDLVVSSDGIVVHSPRFARRGSKKIKRRRRALSRKRGSKKGERPSKSYRKSERKLIKATQYVKNQRDDALAKMADAFCHSYGYIFIEDLKPQNMVRKGGSRKRGLNRSILDASFAKFRDYLFRQAKKYDTEVVVVDRFYPSTKTCHRCGYTQKMALGDRTYVCESCGFTCDRDLNAALNIRDEGLKTYGAESASVIAGGSEGVALHVCTIGTKQINDLIMRLGAAVGNDSLISCMDVASILNREFEDTG